MESGRTEAVVVHNHRTTKSHGGQWVGCKRCQAYATRIKPQQHTIHSEVVQTGEGCSQAGACAQLAVPTPKVVVSRLRSGSCSLAACRNSQAQGVHVDSGLACGEEKVGLRQASCSAAIGEVTVHTLVTKVCNEVLQGSAWPSYRMCCWAAGRWHPAGRQATGSSTAPVAFAGTVWQ